MKIYKYQTCPWCRGHGKDFTLKLTWLGFRKIYSGKNCGRCLGEGVIRVIWGEAQ